MNAQTLTSFKAERNIVNERKKTILSNNKRLTVNVNAFALS